MHGSRTIRVSILGPGRSDHTDSSHRDMSIQERNHQANTPSRVSPGAVPRVMSSHSSGEVPATGRDATSCGPVEPGWAGSSTANEQPSPVTTTGRPSARAATYHVGGSVGSTASCSRVVACSLSRLSWSGGGVLNPPLRRATSRIRCAAYGGSSPSAARLATDNPGTTRSGRQRTAGTSRHPIDASANNGP